MRRAVLIFLILNLAIVAFLVHYVWILLTLLVVKGTADGIPVSEVPAQGSIVPNDRPQMIPKMIHQTYINDTIPEIWQEAQASCRELHKESDGWEYKLWTDAMSRDFVEKEYPSYLETFDGYTYPIERADAIRYFVLAHYGGIYIDLDNGCARSLEPLLAYPAWVRRTIPTGISNDVMGSVPGHPFFRRVIEELPRYDSSWVLPYISVMASTGPLFLSIIWRHWSSEGLNTGDGVDGGRIRLLFPDLYNKGPESFFTHHQGSSWHQGDAKLIFWMAQNWLLITICGFAIAGIVFFVIWSVFGRVVLKPTGSPKLLARRRMPFWRRLVTPSKKQEYYELVSEHDA